MGRAVVLVVLALAARSARADDATALFEQGRTLSQQGKFAEACARFEQSFALDPAPGTELNLGDCHEHLGKVAEAWRDFDAAAARFEAVHDDRAKYARQRRDAVEKHTGVVIVTGIADGAAVTIAGRSVAGELRARVDPGDVEIRAGDVTRHAHVGEGDTVSVDFATVPAPAPPPPAIPSPSPSPPPPTDDSATRRHHRLWLAYGIGGAGALGEIIAITVAVRASSDYNAELDNGNCQRTSGAPVCNATGKAHLESAISLANTGTAIAIVSACAIGGAAALYFTAPRSRVVVAPTATTSAAGVVVAGHF